MAKRKFEQPRCIFCGRFIKWSDFPDKVVYHNFTSATDCEPREDEFAHKSCDEKDREATRRLTCILYSEARLRQEAQTCSVARAVLATHYQEVSL